jgi:hypothetical protein
MLRYAMVATARINTPTQNILSTNFSLSCKRHGTQARRLCGHAEGCYTVLERGDHKQREAKALVGACARAPFQAAAE